MLLSSQSWIHRVVVVALLCIGSPLNLAIAATTARFFPETGHQLNDPFLSYWDSYGTLPIFGYPRERAVHRT